MATTGNCWPVADAMPPFTACNRGPTMKQPKVSRVQDSVGKVYRGFGQGFEKGFDRVRRLIPANDDRHETAFLPAALEVVETPPSPLGRMLLYTICSLFVIAWAWAYFGKVD